MSVSRIDLVAALQVIAAQVECERAERNLAVLGFCGGMPPQDILETQEKLARLEGLCHIVVDAKLQPSHAVLRLRPSRQHQDRDVGGFSQGTRDVEPAFARHHDVENDAIEGKPPELRARRGPVFGLRDPEAVLPQITAKQVPDALVVVHDKDVRRVVRQSRYFEIERLIDGHVIMRSLCRLERAYLRTTFDWTQA